MRTIGRGLLGPLLVCYILHFTCRGVRGPVAASAAQVPTNGGDATAVGATLHVTVRNVAFDIVVVDDHGNPVKGLKPTDFVLFEDGAPQKLLSFTERDAISAEPSVTPQRELPPNTFADHEPVVNSTAMTVLLFDTSQLSDPDAAYARDQAADYLKRVKPGTPMCVFDLAPWGLRLIQDFTTDTSALEQAIESRRNAQKPKLLHFTPVFRRNLGLQQLARYLSSFPGRKNLIWFTGYAPQIVPGRPRGLFPDITSIDESPFGSATSTATATLTFNGVAIYTVDPRGVVFNLEDISFPYSGYDDFGISHVSPQASVNFRRDSEAAVLQQGQDATALTAKSGGKAFFNSNAIEKAVAEVVSTGSHYYSVSYSPTNNNWDGAFRSIKVSFAGTLTSNGLNVAKLHLEYRNGYFAQDMYHGFRTSLEPNGSSTVFPYAPQANPAEDSLGQAMSFGAVAPFQVLFQVHITPNAQVQKIERDISLPPGNYLAPQWRKDPYRNFAIRFSVDPNNIAFVRSGMDAYEGNIEFLAVVYDLNGNIVNSFDDAVPLHVNGDNMEKIGSAGIGAEVPIAVPAKGNFYLRVAVRDPDSGRIGALEIPTASIRMLTDTVPAPKTTDETGR